MNKVALRPKEVEEFYGIAEQTLANWRLNGRGPNYVKPGGRMILYPKADLDSYLKAYRVTTSN